MAIEIVSSNDITKMDKEQIYFLQECHKNKIRASLQILENLACRNRLLVRVIASVPTVRNEDYV